MEELGLVVPRTHVLKDIQALLVTHYAALVGLRRGLTFLTRFAVETRYPRGQCQQTSSSGFPALGQQSAQRLP